MNMKKAIAGIFAGAVAISAVATTMASAKTISYAALDTTIDVSQTSYYAKNYSKTYEQNWAASQVTADAAANETIKFTFNDTNKGVTAVKFTLTDNTLGTKIVDGKELTEDTTTAGVIDYLYTLDATTAAKVVKDHAYSVKLSYEVLPTTTKEYSSKSNAKDKNPDDAYSLVVDGTSAANALFGLTDATYNDTATFEITNSKSVKINANGDAYLPESVVTKLASVLEARTKATITLNFADPDFDDDDVTVSMKVYGTTFTTAKLTSDYKASDDTATFNWIDFIKSVSSTNTLGDVSNRFDNVRIYVDADDVADDKQFELKSITVKSPSENYEELSAGEPVADTTAAITTAATAATTTAAPATEATTTAAASNPKTGNAPVALAVIPVAIAAAAIIAKKRG